MGKKITLILQMLVLLILLGCSEDEQNSLPDNAVTEQTIEQNVLLKHAIINQQVTTGMIGVFLAKGADIDFQDVNNKTPLIHAIEAKVPYEIIEFLLNNGANSELTDSKGNKALTYAFTLQADSKIVQTLLAASTDNDSSDSSENQSDEIVSLIYAMQHQTKEAVVSTLLTQGADITATNQFQQNALMIGFLYDASKASIMRLLQEDIAINDTDAHGKTALIFSTYAYNHIDSDIIQNLLDKGADINQQDNLGRTALFWAIINKVDGSIIEYLLDKGADVDIQDIYGNTALSKAMQYDADQQSLVALIGASKDIDSKIHWKDGRTILMQLARKNADIEAIRAAINQNADVNAKSRDLKLSPLIYALEAGADSALVQLLLDEGAKANVRGTYDATSLKIALEKKYGIDIITHIINDNFDMNAEDVSSSDILKAAFDAKADLEIIHLLIAAGAEIGIEQRPNSYTSYSVLAAFKYGMTNDLFAKLTNYNVIDSYVNSFLTLAFYYNAERGVIDYLLSKTTNISNGIEIFQQQPLMAAFQHYDALTIEMVELLLEKGGDLKQLKYTKENPLMLLLYNQPDIELVRYLLSKDKNINVNMLGSRGTALTIALEHKASTQVLKLLFDIGADSRLGNFGISLTHELAFYRQVDFSIIEYMMAQGLAKYIAENSETPLLMLATRHSTEAVRYFLQQGADANLTYKTNTPLMYAVGNDANSEIVTLLLEYGAQIDSKDKFGQTALLDNARSNKANSVITQILLDAGANINAKDNDGRTLLMRVLENGADKQHIKLLLAAGANADINSYTSELKYTSPKYQNALIVALKEKLDIATLQILLDAGADVNAIHSLNKETPLQFALANGASIETIKFLLAAGANMTLNDASHNHASSILEFALEHENKREIIDLLLDAGADINFQKKYGRNNALAAALKYDDDIDDNIDVISLLIDRGAQLVLESNAKQSPFDIATDTYVPDIHLINYMLEHGVKPQPKTDSARKSIQRTFDKYNRSDYRIYIPGGGQNINARNDFGSTALLLALDAQAPTKIIHQILDAGADIRIMGDNYMNALMVAFNENADETIINRLIKDSAQLNHISSDSQNSTMLMFALRYKNITVDMIRRLVKTSRPDIEATNKFQATALMMAIRNNVDADIIAYLIEEGANIEAKDRNNKTPFMLAFAHRNSDEIIQMLIDKGANILARDNNGKDALLYGLSNGLDMRWINYVLDNGADINYLTANGLFPLYAAVKHSNDAVMTLLKRGADINQRNTDGETALFNLYPANFAVLDILIEQGIDLFAEDKDRQTAYHQALENYDRTALENWQMNESHSDDGPPTEAEIADSEDDDMWREEENRLYKLADYFREKMQQYPEKWKNIKKPQRLG